MYLAESVRNVLSDDICWPRFGAHLEGIPGSASPDGSWMGSHFGVVSGRFPEEANFSGSFAGCDKRSHLGQRCRVSVTRPEQIIPSRHVRGSSRSRPAPWLNSLASEGEMQLAAAVQMSARRAWISLLHLDDVKLMIGAWNHSHFERLSLRFGAVRRFTEEESQRASGPRSHLRIADNQRAQELVPLRTTGHDREAPRLSPERFFAGC